MHAGCAQLAALQQVFAVTMCGAYRSFLVVVSTVPFEPPWVHGMGLQGMLVRYLGAYM